MKDIHHGHASQPLLQPETEAQTASQQAEAAMADLQQAIDFIKDIDDDQKVESIESLALEVLGQDPESRANMRLLEAARDTGNNTMERQIIDSQRAILRRITGEIAFMCGVSDMDIDVEEQKERYRARVVEKAASLGPAASDEEVMVGLGFIQIVDTPEGPQRQFTFPEGLFPSYIQEQWESYSEYVKNHLLARDKYSKGVADNADEVVRWDYVRRLTHNALAESVKDFLHLGEWDTERCRDFISKMLEERMPTKKTDEEANTSKALQRNLREIDTILHAQANHPATQSYKRSA